MWVDLHTAGVTGSRGHSRDLRSTNTSPVRVGSGNRERSNFLLGALDLECACCKPACHLFHIAIEPWELASVT